MVCKRKRMASTHVCMDISVWHAVDCIRRCLLHFAVCHVVITLKYTFVCWYAVSIHIYIRSQLYVGRNWL